MLFVSLVGFVFAASLVQAQSSAPGATMQADVDRLVRAAGELTDYWPRQPAPPIPEVADVARYGRAVTPLLLALLSDDPDVEQQTPRWKTQQQAALALVRIYQSAAAPCGSNYCDQDQPERVASIKQTWIRNIAADDEIRALSTADLLDRFLRETSFTKQTATRDALAARGDRSVIPKLESWLTIEDRHLRANAALVIGRLGDSRGFDTLVAMLSDRSPRPIGQGIPGGRPSVEAQIRADRYFAAHSLGGLKDPRAVDVLVPLLNDPDVSHAAPWALVQLGDRRAISPLLGQLDRDEATTRVLAIHALELLNAREALPRLRELSSDTRGSSFGGLITVGEAARHAIAVIAGR